MTDRYPSPPPLGDFEKPFFGEGIPVQHPFAVIYQGEFETAWDGTAVAVRAHARSLASTGIPVLLKSFTGQVIDENGVAQARHVTALDPKVDREIGALEGTTAKAYFPIIKHAVIRDGEHLKRLVIPQGVIGRTTEEQVLLRQQIFASTIVYSVWERDRVDPSIVKTLSRVAECWVPCRANQHMLVASGVPAEKVHVIPHPYDPTDPIVKLAGRLPDLEWRKFYSIGRWEPRKGYAELVEAFLTAFTPRDKTVLTIKYTGGKWPDYPTPEEAVARASERTAVRGNGWTPASIKARVKLIQGRFPRNAILELHYRNNIYVSSSHGEAWCLPAFEACLAGNQVVYVPSGGTEDFVGNGHVAVRPVGPVPVPRSYGWEADAEWVGFTVSELADALRKASSPTSHGSEQKRLFRPEDFSLDGVGKLMRSRVLKVAKISSKATAYYDSCSRIEE